MKLKLMKNIGIIFALLSAVFYAFNVIVEKMYINELSSYKILFLMYLGGGIGLLFIHLFAKTIKSNTKNKITKKEIPKILLIIFCELMASILIIEAIKRIDSSLVSLLCVFEIVMTSLCAYYIFKDPITKHETISIVLIFIGGIILNFKYGIFSNISISSLLVIGACFFWGIMNNVTAKISFKEPEFLTSIKCLSVALLYFIMILIKGDLSFNYPILILYGFFTYGFGILFYVISTKYLGASKATLVFSFSSIFGALFAFIIFKEMLTYTFIISAIIMIIGIMIMNFDEN